MAESVDALVSNTSGATHPGSSPGLGTISTTTCWSQNESKVLQINRLQHFSFLVTPLIFPHIFPTEANLSEGNGIIKEVFEKYEPHDLNNYVAYLKSRR